MSETVIIAGAGNAAGQVITSLRQAKFPGRIVLVGDEPFVPYQRPPLSKKFLAGELELERLYLKPEKYYPDHEVELRLGTRVESVDRSAGVVETSNGEQLNYDHLVLATGSRVRRMNVPGHELKGIHYLRTIADVNAIRTYFQAGRNLVVVGAGYIGLEVAAVAVSHGLNVSVLEMEDRAMSRVTAPEVSAFFADVHRKAGVDLRFGTAVDGFSGIDHVDAVECADGSSLPTDVVIVGIGILPATELAEDAGLACDNGILVDEYCRTDDPRILAVGDCTRHPNRFLNRSLRLESVHNAVEQGKTAAATILGQDKPYQQVPWFWSDQYDLKLQIVGLSQGHDRLVIRGNPAERSYAAVYFDAENRLIAVDAISSPREFMAAKKLIPAGARMDPDRVADTSVPFKELAMLNG